MRLIKIGLENNKVEKDKRNEIHAWNNKTFTCNKRIKSNKFKCKDSNEHLIQTKQGLVNITCHYLLGLDEVVYLNKAHTNKVKPTKKQQ